MPVERRQRGEPIAWTRQTGQNFQLIQPVSFRPPSISRLSDEQLWRVLYLIAGDPPSWDTSPAASLSLVCKKWKTIINCNPSLWTYIFIDETITLARLRMHLARSEIDPLHIHFSDFEYDPDEEKYDPEPMKRNRALLNHVWENLPRCRHLVLGDPLITLIVLSMMPSHIRLTQLYHLSVVWPSLGQHPESHKIDRRKWMLSISQLDATKIFSNLRSLTVVTEGLTLDGFSWSILIRPNQLLKRLALHIQSVEHQQELVTTLHDISHSLEKLTLRVEKEAGVPDIDDLPALPALRTLRFESDLPPGWLQTFISSTKYLHQLTLDIVQPAVGVGYASALGAENYLPLIPMLGILRIYVVVPTFTNPRGEEGELMVLLAKWLNRLPSLTSFTFADYRPRFRLPRQIDLKLDLMLYELARRGGWALRINHLNFLYVEVSVPALAALISTRDAALSQLRLPVIPLLYIRMTEFQGYTNHILQVAAQRGVIIAEEY